MDVLLEVESHHSNGLGQITAAEQIFSGPGELQQVASAPSGCTGHVKSIPTKDNLQLVLELNWRI